MVNGMLEAMLADMPAAANVDLLPWINATAANLARIQKAAEAVRRLAPTSALALNIAADVLMLAVPRLAKARQDNQSVPRADFDEAVEKLEDTARVVGL